MDRDWQTIVQYGVAGFLMAILALLNLLQILAHVLTDRVMATAPMIVQRTGFVGASAFAVSFLLRTWAAPSMAVFSVVRIFWSVGSISISLICSLVVYETTRNAYLAMYFESQVLPTWPFLSAFAFTCSCSIAASILLLSTNRERFHSIGVLGFGTFFLGMFLFGVYYYRKMMAHLNQGRDSTISEGLRSYRRFFWIMSVVILAVTLVEYYLAASLVVNDVEFYTEAKMQKFSLDLYLAPLIIAGAAQTWWTWKPLCGEPQHAVVPSQASRSRVSSQASCPEPEEPAYQIPRTVITLSTRV
eukprot:TRINITY_DN2933_c0_g1_i3.p1 TRINITY_DN2933_c0_g1~~TRINITY_DN2933_c0_g1_i3.p1  ORF type:complete len:301 (+),score=30.21 TRINITY_DN2933_c0_g1_i3:70-972(+)